MKTADDSQPHRKSPLHLGLIKGRGEDSEMGTSTIRQRFLSHTCTDSIKPSLLCGVLPGASAPRGKTLGQDFRETAGLLKIFARGFIGHHPPRKRLP